MICKSLTMAQCPRAVLWLSAKVFIHLFIVHACICSQHQAKHQRLASPSPTAGLAEGLDALLFVSGCLPCWQSTNHYIPKHTLNVIAGVPVLQTPCWSLWPLGFSAPRMPAYGLHAAGRVVSAFALSPKKSRKAMRSLVNMMTTHNHVLP